MPRPLQGEIWRERKKGNVKKHWNQRGEEKQQKVPEKKRKPGCRPVKKQWRGPDERLWQLEPRTWLGN